MLGQAVHQDTHAPFRTFERIQEGVRCKSMTLKEACSVPKHTSAMCVQSFDDSLNSAIHTTYRISLRSSSLREPRYPLSRVLVALKTRYIRYRGAQKRYKTCIESHNTCVGRGYPDRFLTECAQTNLHTSHTTSQFTRVGMDITIMILPQVHLRKPCYDFYFL